ncbi:MAG: hypothetical protein GY820_20255, partial [Gammaproteobacteria bacterium]|nr:hypothetical protein [Gammaproteobacteria bacterium]
MNFADWEGWYENRCEATLIWGGGSGSIKGGGGGPEPRAIFATSALFPQPP